MHISAPGIQQARAAPRRLRQSGESWIPGRRIASGLLSNLRNAAKGHSRPFDEDRRILSINTLP